MRQRLVAIVVSENPMGTRRTFAPTEKNGIIKQVISDKSILEIRIT
jgi:hypothetical protein